MADEYVGISYEFRESGAQKVSTAMNVLAKAQRENTRAQYEAVKVAYEYKKSAEQQAAVNDRVAKSNQAIINSYGASANIIGQMTSANQNNRDAQLKANYAFNETTGSLEKMTFWQKISVGQWKSAFPAITKVNNALNTVRWTMVNVAFAFAGIAMIAAPFVLLVKRGMELEEQFNKLGIVAQRSAKEMSSAMRDLRRGTIYTLDEVTNATTEFVRRGFDINETMTAMPHVMRLALTGFVDMEAAIKAVTQILHSYNLSIEQTYRVTNLLNIAADTSAATVDKMAQSLSYAAPSAASAGIEIEDLVASLALLQNAGLEASRAGTGFAAVIMSIKNPTDKTKQAMDELGISFFDVEGRMKSMATITRELAAATAHLSQEDRLAFMADLFTTRGERAGLLMLETFIETGDTIDDLKESFEEFSYSYEQEMERMATMTNTFKSAWQDLKSATIDPLASRMNDELRGILGVLQAPGLITRPGSVRTDDMDTAERMAAIQEEINAHERRYRTLVNFEQGLRNERARSMKGLIAYIGFSKAVSEEQEEMVSVITNLKNELNELNAEYQASEAVAGDAARAAKEFALAMSPDALGAAINSLGAFVGKFDELVYASTQTAELRFLNSLKEVGSDILSTYDRIVNHRLYVSGLDAGIVGQIGLFDDLISKYEDTVLLLADKQRAMKLLSAEIRVLQNNYNSISAELGELNELFRETEDAIGRLSNPRFVNQVGMEKLMHGYSQEVKRAKLESIGIVDVYGFIEDAVNGVEGAFDGVLASMKSVEDATKSSEDAYRRWQTTVSEYIRGLIVHGNELAMNTSDAVQHHATLLQSVSRFADETKKEKTDEERILEALGMAYDYHYGGMTEDVKLAMQAHSDSRDVIFNTSQEVVSALQTQWDAQDRLGSKIAEVKGRLDEAHDALEDKKSVYQEYASEVDVLTLSLVELESQAVSAANKIQSLFDLMDIDTRGAAPDTSSALDEKFPLTNTRSFAEPSADIGFSPFNPASGLSIENININNDPDGLKTVRALETELTKLVNKHVRTS